MGRETHFSLLLFNKLTLLVEAKDYAALTAFLEGLSHSQFRTAGHVLGERIAPSLGAADFWPLFQWLVSADAKAFLVTLLKSFIRGMEQGSLSVDDDGFQEAAARLRTSAIDAQKTVQTLLPVLRTDVQVRRLFALLGFDEMSAWIPFLVRAFHPATAFVLLQALHYVEQDRALLLRVARHLMQRGDSFSFNVASLIKTVYGLDELRGTFSLRLEPFQLARVENSFDVFCQTVDFH